MGALAGRLRARLLVLVAVAAVAGPLALLAAAADALPMTRCADSSAVSRAGDWELVRARTSSSPFALAFFTLVEELEIVPRASDGYGPGSGTTTRAT